MEQLVGFMADGSTSVYHENNDIYNGHLKIIVYDNIYLCVCLQFLTSLMCIFKY